MKLKLILGSTLTLCSLAWLTSCSLTDKQELASSELTTGFITSNKINEASGIAVSHINEDVIWINNDSANEAAIYAVNSRGEHLATLNVSGIENNDWEDLATFNYKGHNYILIADVGDNYSERTNYQLHFIKEPMLRRTQGSQEVLTTKPEWTITFTYGDKQRDCESVAVDAINQQILLLSKREFPQQLFTLPLKAEETEQPMIAQRLGKISPLPSPLHKRFGMLDIMNYSNMPTAMDISADDSMAAVLTYSSAYLYLKKNGDSWLEAFSHKPKRIDFPILNQGEAIGFDQSGENIYITTEKTLAPILKIDVSKYKSN
jgi:hypothetical protein